MDENKMMQKINDAVQPPAGVGFEDIRARIEAQSEKERENSSKETLTLLKDTNTGAYGVKRIAAFAASMIVVLGLGMSLIVFGMDTMSSDMAATESVADSAAEEFAVEEPNMAFTDAPVDTVTTTQENDEESDGQSAEVGDSENVVITDGTETSAETANGTSGLGYVTHTIDALGLTIDLPENAYVTGRNVSGDFELLEVYGMSAAQLEANYKSRNIYYNAMWYDEDADITEIVIKMTTDDISDDIFNLSKANDEQLARIEELYHNYEENIDAVVGAQYYNVSMVEHEQALFFRAEGMVNNRSGRSNHLQYMTIINGCRIEITLIEHFGIEGELTGEEPEEISQTHAEIMERVIQSVQWDKVKSNFWRENRGVVFYCAITIAGIAAIVFVLLLPENKKKPKERNSAVSENETSTVDESKTPEIDFTEAEGETADEDNSAATDNTDNLPDAEKAENDD